MNKIRLYKKRTSIPRRLIASFQPDCKEEAQLCCDFMNSLVLKVAFELEQEENLQACKPDTSGLHVDLTNATKTLRAIAIELSEHTLHDNLEMIAYSKRYGTIRGKVSPSDQGRLLFWSRLRTIWPNAVLSKL
jgi:hypothetical protein